MITTLLPYIYNSVLLHEEKSVIKEINWVDMKKDILCISEGQGPQI